jgi:hypothetical protein
MSYSAFLAIAVYYIKSNSGQLQLDLSDYGREGALSYS